VARRPNRDGRGCPDADRGSVECRGLYQRAAPVTRQTAPPRLSGDFLLVLWCLAVSGCFTQANLPERVTVENIRRIELGMTRLEVETILGPPVKIEHFGGTYPESLLYFTRLWTPIHYPMLWVHFRDGHVFEVYGKRHNALDSDAVYRLYEGGTGWEKPNDFLNTFPHR
jgi:hypothetical protein